MDPYIRKHILDGLDPLSIENLQAGRITISAMAHAVRYAEKGNCNFARENLGGVIGGSSSDLVLADVLNDMFEAARCKKEGAESAAPQEKKYKYRVVYHNASGMPVEWLTNKIEQHGGSVIKFQDHNGKIQVCFAQYKVTDLTQPDPEEKNTPPPRKRYRAVSVGEGYNILFDSENPPSEVDAMLGQALLRIALYGRHAVLVSSITPDIAPSLIDAVGDETVKTLIALGDKRMKHAEGSYGQDQQQPAEDKCPSCREGALKKHPRLTYFRCDKCGGVYTTLPVTKPKKKFTLDDLKKVSWAGMAEDVSKRIHLLGSLALVAEKTPLMDKITEDLILPNICLLAEFCENVEIKED